VKNDSLSQFSTIWGISLRRHSIESMIGLLAEEQEHYSKWSRFIMLFVTWKTKYKVQKTKWRIEFYPPEKGREGGLEKYT